MVSIGYKIIAFFIKINKKKLAKSIEPYRMDIV